MPQRIETKRKDGAARNEEWSKLSPQDKLASLDSRLGVGVGAKRQRTKLQTEIAGAVKVIEVPTATKDEPKPRVTRQNRKNNTTTP